MAGVNFAKLELIGTDVIQPDIRTGLVGGFFVTMPLAHRVGLEADVLYSQKGAKVTQSGNTATASLDYLDVPVLARVAATGGPTRLVIVAGPSFGFKLRARSKLESSGQPADEEDIGSEVSSFDFGFVVGAGLEAGAFLVDGRYQWGLSNASKAEFGATDVRNRVFSVLFGIKF
jgi:hypothetical protein